MYNEKHYFKLAFSPDLSGSDRVVYRALEIFPGALAWVTLLGMVAASFLVPVWAAVFIIVFDVYWLVKTVFLSFHLRANFKRMRENLKINWHERLSRLRYEHIWQLIILPMSKESYEIVRDTVSAIKESRWPKEKMIVVLSYEERYEDGGKETALRIKEEFSQNLPFFLVTCHPEGTEGEIPGKGSNESWAAKFVKENFIDKNKIPYENIIVSSFDIDTHIYTQYFEILTWNFLTAQDPLKSSYQPVPVYNNNIWATPALSRVVATSGTFWQMMQQERPERLTTFSSHSMSFKSLAEMDFWQKNIVSEDSRIFWNALLFYNGDYRSIPLSYPVSLDANLAPTLWGTVKNVYKQQRRWAWGVENFSYVAFGFIKNKKIAFRKKAHYLFAMVEGFWSWSTNSILIFALGWLPLLLGGRKFNQLVLAYNLPQITRIIMMLAMVGLITSAIISMKLLPPRPKEYGKWKNLSMALQWVLVPVVIIFFGAIPALDAQTRLMLGRYMGFWITPKERK